MLINPLTIISILPGWLKLAATGAVIASSLIAYDHFIDDPKVAAEARKGYVQKVQLDTAIEALKNLKTQLDQNKILLEHFKGQMVQLEENRKKTIAQTEQEIQDYERQLAEAGRRCVLDQRDVEWLRKS